MSSMLPPPSPTKSAGQHSAHDDSDADTASQKSISLSSPPRSRRNSFGTHDPRQSFSTSSSGDSHPFKGATRFSVDSGLYPSSDTDVVSTWSAPSHNTGDDGGSYFKPATYPPSPPPIMKNRGDDTMSIASTSSRKTRPESLLITPRLDEPLILGVALVDFNHLVGPRIEYHRGDVFEDDEVSKILPFLALPDGAHLSNEDYSYFHLVKPGFNPTTIFGISCNQQIPAASLINKPADVTRSTVQKAVVVLASKPVFGPIREKLRVVTTALFMQRDFSDPSILDDFGTSLERSLRTQLTESGLYMGTSLRDLVLTFRQRTLVLVKALMLQKRIMFYGYPVEKLCTYQYSLVSLLPGLLQTLDDSGSPPLANRAPTLTRPSSLKTSDHKSMMAFMGLPLDIFGKDAFFQPYLPLQQLDMVMSTPSWLCGCTNSIITHQKDIDLLVNTETGTFEFRDAKLERSAGLTSADRKWMDDILHDVNETKGNEDGAGGGMHQFKGSDDYLRSKFEEYISAALSCVKYRDFISKGENGGVIITGGTGAQPNSADDFNPLWLSEFRTTKAYEVWNRITDPVIFDLIEPRHPCPDKPSAVADFGLRIQEGIQDLKLDQQLAPAREAVARTLTVGSSSFFKAVEGVKGRWGFSKSTATPTTATPTAGGGGIRELKMASSASTGSRASSRASTPPIEVSKADLDGAGRGYVNGDDDDWNAKTAVPPPETSRLAVGGSRPPVLRPFSLTSTNSLPPMDSPSPGVASNGAGAGAGAAVGAAVRPLASAWSAGIGSFFGGAKAAAATTPAPATSQGSISTSASTSTSSTVTATNGATTSGLGRFSNMLRSSTSSSSSIPGLANPPASAPPTRTSLLSDRGSKQMNDEQDMRTQGYAPLRVGGGGDGDDSPSWDAASPLFSGPLSAELSPGANGNANGGAVSFGTAMGKVEVDVKGATEGKGGVDKDGAVVEKVEESEIGAAR